MNTSTQAQQRGLMLWVISLVAIGFGLLTPQGRRHDPVWQVTKLRAPPLATMCRLCFGSIFGGLRLCRRLCRAMAEPALGSVVSHCHRHSDVLCLRGIGRACRSCEPTNGEP